MVKIRPRVIKIGDNDGSIKQTATKWLKNKDGFKRNQDFALFPKFLISSPNSKTRVSLEIMLNKTRVWPFRLVLASGYF